MAGSTAHSGARCCSAHGRKQGRSHIQSRRSPPPPPSSTAACRWKAEAMAAFGIMSMSPLKKWCALYREGGAKALRPRPAGRFQAASGPARRSSRSGAVGSAEMAYLKKITRPGREGRALTRAKAEAVAGMRAEGHALGHLLACAELKRSTYYYALAHPPRPTRAELWEASGRSSRAPPTAAGTGR